MNPTRSLSPRPVYVPNRRTHLHDETTIRYGKRVCAVGLEEGRQVRFASNRFDDRFNLVRSGKEGALDELTIEEWRF